MKNRFCVSMVIVVGFLIPPNIRAHTSDNLDSQMLERRQELVIFVQTHVQALDKMAEELKREGGDEAVRQANEYHYHLVQEVESRFTEFRPSDARLDAVADELENLLDTSERALTHDEAQESLSKAMALLNKDLNMMFEQRLDILDTMSGADSPAFVSSTSASGEKIRDYGFLLAKVGMYLDWSDRLTRVINSYQNATAEIAGRDFRNASLQSSRLY